MANRMNLSSRSEHFGGPGAGSEAQLVNWAQSNRFKRCKYLVWFVETRQLGSERWPWLGECSLAFVEEAVHSMSPVTLPNYEGDSAKIVSSAGSNTMQISGDSVSPPYHHVHVRKSSSPIPAHPETQIPIDTKHTSPKKC